MTKEFPEKLMQIGQALQEALANKPVKLAQNDYNRRASVLIPLCWEQDQVQVLFTKRTSHLPHHAGQISFPGGSMELQDSSLAHTAMRETHEEIGVPMENMGILTRLDQLTTATGFLVTPYLGLINYSANYSINENEVEKIIIVPLVKVLNPANYQPVEIQWQGTRTYWTALVDQGEVIWGVTARILLGFIDSLKQANFTLKD